MHEVVTSALISASALLGQTLLRTVLEAHPTGRPARLLSRQVCVIELTAALPLGVSLMVLLSYAVGQPFWRHWGSEPAMALSTAVCITCLSLHGLLVGLHLRRAAQEHAQEQAQDHPPTYEP